jgi:LuxR family transcriptional regulator, regulator of acetate metabolism
VQAARGRLHSFTHGELLVHIPREACHALGFDRAFLALVQDGDVVGGGVWDDDDPAAASDFVRLSRALGPKLADLPLETEVVERRRPALVTDVDSDPRVYRALATVAGVESFVVAPLVHGDRTLALLYADRQSGVLLDVLDRELLWTFATAVAPILHVAALRAFARPRTADGVAAVPRIPLTPRETDVLRLMCEGASNAAIGVRLFISETTVKSHVQQILRKLQVSNRTEAVSRYGALVA